MNSSRWRQVKQLFYCALERDSAERAAFLDQACPGDHVLRGEVEALLASHEDAPDFMDEPAFDVWPERLLVADEAGEPGRRIGPYKVLREIGHGGMGAVYVAERDDDEFRKQVAVKLVRGGLATADLLRRFRTERQILADLDHANIARLLDGGTTDDGLPYLVMEYIEGLPVNEYCDRHRLSITERLKLFRTICGASSHAHRNLVIHRDIKPANILVTPDGVPKLLDFGIAKLLDPAPGERAQTMTAFQVMTPQYASPEQIRGETVTTATDVYSLGVLLYELLTGRHPYALSSDRPEEVVRLVCHEAPEKPSTAIRRAGRGSSFGVEHPEKLRRRLAGDLDNIVLMAMRKEPQRRYSSVERLSEDVRRYLDGLPVLAQKDTFGYRSAKFIRRHKAGVAAAALAVLVLVAGIIATTWQARIAAMERDKARLETNKARIEAAKAERISAFLRDVFSYANPSWYAPGFGKGGQATVAEALAEASKRLERELKDQPEIKADIHHTLGDTYRALGLYADAEPHFQAALKRRKEIYPAGDPKVAESLYYLGAIRFITGDYDLAEQLYRQAVNIQRTAQGEGTKLPYMLIDLAELLHEKGDFANAESLLTEALGLFRSRYGEAHVGIGAIHAVLGRIHDARGDLAAAEQQCRESLRIYQRLSGDPVAEMAQPLICLGEAHAQRREYRQAETLIVRALELLRTSLGSDHPSAVTALVSLANVAYLQRDDAKARAAIHKALTIHRRSLHENHPQFAAWLTVSGLIAAGSGEYASAESQLRKALNIRQRHLPRDHWLVAMTEGALGECLMAQKRYAEAEPLLAGSYRILISSQGKEHPRTALAQRRLASLHDVWRRPG